MLFFMLLFAGICTFFNGLGLLNILNGKDLRFLNLFVALLQALTLILMLWYNELSGPFMYMNMTAVVLFLFTYAYIAFTAFANLDPKGLSLYCGMVALIAVGFAFVCLILQNDFINFLEWIQWAVLWLFFCLICFKPSLVRFTGFLAILIAWSSLIIPSFLQITLLWNVITVHIYLASVAIVALFIVIYPITCLLKRKKA